MMQSNGEWGHSYLHALLYYTESSQILQNIHKILDTWDGQASYTT